MFDWLHAPAESASPISLGVLILRLVLALIFGSAVAGIYRWTKRREEVSDSLATTLVLLAILIAVVTQVIGDNVARAFSLVGALSIVRFRTVVQDTRDTAFVIFAVVTGMAVGASNFSVAVTGLVVVGIAACLFQPTKKSRRATSQQLVLSLRLAAGRDPQKLVVPLLTTSTNHHELTVVETARRGTALDVVYLVQLKPEIEPTQLVAELNRLEGVQSVSLKRDA